MPFIYPTTDLNLAGKTLIVPVVSTGNVSQLAADLLIATLSLRRLAIFNPSFFVPIVGGREDGIAGISTPLELFGKDSLDVLIILQRSPVLKSQKQNFVDALLGFIKSTGIASALFLSGMDLSSRTDAQMLTPTYYIQPSKSPSLASSSLHRLSMLPVPNYTFPAAGDDATPFIPGGGLSRRMLSSIPSDWSIPTVLLLQFVLEGDNKADSHLLAAVVAKILGIDHLVQEWRQPSSWQQGLFGAPHDQTLYG